MTPLITQFMMRTRLMNSRQRQIPLLLSVKPDHVETRANPVDKVEGIHQSVLPLLQIVEAQHIAQQINPKNK